MARRHGTLANSFRLLAAGSVAGCALHPLPDVQLAVSEAAIVRALEAGAATHAPRELSLATEKLQLSRRWIASRDYEPARWLAEQAEVDAELAAMKAITARKRAELRE